MGAMESLAASFALAAIGAGLTRLRLISAPGWAEIEKLTYWVLFPALLISSIAKAPLAGGEAAKLAAALVGGQVLAFAAVWLTARRRVSGPVFASLVQGGVRYNTYVALATAFAAQGAAGVERLTPALAPLIVMANVLSVAAHLAGPAEGAASPWRRALREMASNPLILASLAGLALNLSGIGLARLPATILGQLGGASLPLALLAVGAGLKLGVEARADLPLILWTSLVKFGLWPAAAFAIAWSLGLGEEGRQLAVLTAAAPTATASYVLARRLGGDARLMASLISAETLIAAPVLFLLLGV